MSASRENPRRRCRRIIFFERVQSAHRVTLFLIVVMSLIQLRHAIPLVTVDSLSSLSTSSTNMRINSAGTRRSQINDGSNSASALRDRLMLIGMQLNRSLTSSGSIATGEQVNSIVNTRSWKRSYMSSDDNGDRLMDDDIISYWKRRSVLGLDNLDFAASALDLARAQSSSTSSASGTATDDAKQSAGVNTKLKINSITGPQLQQLQLQQQQQQQQLNGQLTLNLSQHDLRKMMQIINAGKRRRKRRRNN